MTKADLIRELELLDVSTLRELYRVCLYRQRRTKIINWLLFGLTLAAVLLWGWLGYDLLIF